jgi:hypothetical protein
MCMADGERAGEAGIMTRNLAPQMRAVAYRQEGIVRRSQAIEEGLSHDFVRRRVRSGEWQRRGRGVYATFTGKPTPKAELWTAVLLAGPDAVLSHETAAELHGFAENPSRLIHVTVPAGRNPARYHPIPGVIIHRSRTVVAELFGPGRLPQTTAEDTVLDLVVAAASFDDAYGWICRAIARGVTVPSLLRQALARRPRMRWREWIADALDDKDEGINSPLERRYVYGVERAHGLPKAKRQARRPLDSGLCYLDNLYEEYDLCVELDGAAYHSEEDKRAGDVHVNANIANSDVRTMRFGWVAVTEGRCETAQQVAGSLRRHGWTGTPHSCRAGCPVK